MRNYDITGMSCAACSARVEKAVGKVEGVSSCSVSLLTNSMGIEGTASDEEIIKAVTDAGYGASVKGSKKEEKGSSAEDALADRETPVLKKRLYTSAIFLLVLMYFGMGNMFGLPMIPFFKGNYIGNAIMQMVLAIIIMFINRKFFISGFKGLIHKAPNMDTLVALGSGVSFIWSFVCLLLMTGNIHDEHMMMSLHMNLYFESAAMILTLITIGKTLEAYSKGRTTDALKGLMKMAPKTARIVKDGKEVEVDIESVQKGDIFVVRPGEAIPLDGHVVEGVTAVDESSLTGESIPVDKEVDSKVFSGTMNQSGFIKCVAERVGEDTTLSQIIKMVSDASATKAPIAKIADTVSGYFVPAVISIAVITFIVWMALGESLSFSIARAVSVLVISCPCALGLATPVAIMVANGVGAKNGILFKTASSLEVTGKSQIVILDKTGTITEGKPSVTALVTGDSVDEKEFLTLAYSLEKKSEHPLAIAVVEKAEEKGITGYEVSDFSAVPGNGLKGICNGKELIGGSVKYIDSVVGLDKKMKAIADSSAAKGETPIVFSYDKKIIGMISIADRIKSDSKEAVEELKNMGVRVVMLTGDNEKTAKAIASQAGIEEVVAGVLPDGKAEVVRRHKEAGKVAMVGDGINDAPALTIADIGIAIGAGSDIAIDAADVVLMKSSLKDVSGAIRLSRKCVKNIHENLFWAFFYNCIGIPLAAGCYIALFGWKLNPMFGAAAMSLSSFCVVTNALRLNLVNVHDARHDKKIKQNEIKLEKKENKMIEKTMKIEGMMCPHCEATVKKALEAIDGVVEATPSHTAGTAIVKLSKPVDDALLKKTVEDKDYTVLEII
ncbi:MAG: heavy metal translocating P-type ATPase [Sphaerochaetaceae bacterium]|nr:heavy metal translocating P-type ATPase [Sphaerochaetaceae bacterium]